MQVKRILGGLTVVAIGLVLLANTTGYLPWSVWRNILSLWPLLLVAAGIDIIGRSADTVWLRALSSLLVLGGLAYGALVMPAMGASGFVIGTARSATPFSFSEPHDDSIRSGRASVNAGLSRFKLGSGETLATAAGMSPFGTPSFDARKTGSSVVVSVAEHENGPFVFTGRTDSSMDMTLDRSVAWDSLDISAGLSDSVIDLSDLEVTRSDVSVGLSSTTITFGRKALDARATISGGLGSLKLRVPSGLAVELDASTGLGSLNVPSGWTRVSGSGGQSVRRTPGFDSSTGPKLRIDLSAGLGSTNIEEY